MRTVAELERRLSRPREALVVDPRKRDGNILDSGAGGKLSPSLVRLALQGGGRRGGAAPPVQPAELDRVLTPTRTPTTTTSSPPTSTAGSPDGHRRAGYPHARPAGFVKAFWSGYLRRNCGPHSNTKDGRPHGQALEEQA
ncbi:hypothetical protein [Micromonospora sp. NPDC005299]|uniref:hypothetical protein n=1 Tax=Micromonospora sp. NPDC005299 TaxID=3364231 RepID=UPI0036C34894